MTLEYATLLFLIIVVGAAEIYRLKRGSRGVIVAVNDSGLPAFVLPSMDVQVRLPNGEEIAAKANSCTACLGQLKIGDEVSVFKGRDGYAVDLLWLRSRSSLNSRLPGCLDQCKPGKPSVDYVGEPL